MKLILILTITASVLTLNITGCATQGVNSYKYTPPATSQVNNEVVVQAPYSQVWDKLVKEISKSFYVINNIDKESRIINISFSTNNPTDFIDCGNTNRKYTQGEKVEAYDYDTGGSSQFKAAGDKQLHGSWATYYLVNRTANLDGRANIYIAPFEKDKNNTTVTVNSRYIWTLKVNQDFYQEHFNGNTVLSGRVPEKTDSISFNTLSKGELQDGGGKGINLVCISKGKLENELLGIASDGLKANLK